MTTTTLETTRDGVTIRDMLARGAFTVVTVAERGIAAIRQANRKRRTAARLHALSDEMLNDIGVARADIERISYDR